MSEHFPVSDITDICHMWLSLSHPLAAERFVGAMECCVSVGLYILNVHIAVYERQAVIEIPLALEAESGDGPYALWKFILPSLRKPCLLQRQDLFVRQRALSCLRNQNVDHSL